MKQVLVDLVIGSLWLCILVMVVGCFTRLLLTVFSAESRTRIKRRPYLHAAWLCATIAVLTLTIVPVHNSRLVGRQKTEIEMQQVAEAVQVYKSEFSAVPDGTDDAQILKELMSDNPRHIQFISPMANVINLQGELLDAWGTPFLLTIKNRKVPFIRSAGPDRKFGTIDDSYLMRNFRLWLSWNRKCHWVC